MQYGYFCEDSALQVLVEAVLLKFKGGKFERHEEFCDRYVLPVGGNDKMIARRYVEVSQAAHVSKLDLFIVARDYDNRPLAGSEYEKFINSNKKELDIKIRNKTVFCIPARCIEYWLFYIKHWNDENAPQKNSFEHKEDFNCHQAKADVYEGKLENGKYQKQSRETETARAQAILKNLDIATLRSYSHSFDNFIKQLESLP